MEYMWLLSFRGLGAFSRCKISYQVFGINGFPTFLCCWRDLYFIDARKRIESLLGYANGSNIRFGILTRDA